MAAPRPPHARNTPALGARPPLAGAAAQAGPTEPVLTARERLRAALPATVGLLKAHRASEIDPIAIDDYVNLNWLEWQGGDLKLTETGSNICKQLIPRRV